jgi:hypothetical protein
MGEDPCYKTVRNYLKRFESLGLVEWNGIKGAGSRYTFFSTLTLLPNSLFSWSNCLISLGLQLGKGDLPNDAPLPNYSEKNEKTDSELGNKSKSGKSNLPNQFSQDTNSYKELQDISDELGNEVSNIEEDQIENDSDLKPKPSISPDGDLSIPFDSDPEYQWWKGGKNIKEITEKTKHKHK